MVFKAVNQFHNFAQEQIMEEKNGEKNIARPSKSAKPGAIPPPSDGRGPGAQQQQPISASKQAHTKENKRVFGLGREKRPVILPDDYEQRYTPDDFGQEMGPNARVWRVYLDEAELSDRDMVEGWKDGIDVLLVFAGLFSAVVTTFVTQTSQKLDQDFGQIAASLLNELVALQRAGANGTPLDSVPASKLTPDSPPLFTRGDSWVNGLWFSSLMLSLITALFSVLIKQWIQHYISLLSGTPRDRAYLHHFRYLGLERWGVRAIVGVLPVLLYMALFLFMTGLAVFLQALKLEIACIVGALGGITFILYVVTNGLPLFYPQCPYQTPLIQHVHAIILSQVFFCQRLAFLLLHRVVPQLLSHHLLHRLPPFLQPSQRVKVWCEKLQKSDMPIYPRSTLRSLESHAAKIEQDMNLKELVNWLLTVSSNPSVKPIVLQSLSGLDTDFPQMNKLLGKHSLARNELVEEFKRQCRIAKSFGDDPITLVNNPHFYNTERILRASMMIPEPEEILKSSVWDPTKWRIFNRAAQKIPDCDVDPRFHLSLVTYSIQDMRWPGWRDMRSDTPVLFSFSRLAWASTADQYSGSMMWRAWDRILKTTPFCRRSQEVILFYQEIERIYVYLEPLFQTLLGTQSSHYTYTSLLPILSRFLPEDIVRKWYSAPLEHYRCAPDWLEVEKAKFGVMLFTSIICDASSFARSARSSDLLMAEIVLQDTCEQMLLSLKALMTRPIRDYGSLPPECVTGWEELLNHDCFRLMDRHDGWEAKTYESLFQVYFAMCILYPQTLLKSVFISPYPFTRYVLTSRKSVEFCWQTLSISHHCTLFLNMTSQIVTSLDERIATEPIVIKNAFESFTTLQCVKEYYSDGVIPYLATSWPAHMQPIVRWMLDWTITRAGESETESCVNTFAIDLIQRPGFLALICSPFLISWAGQPRRRVVFSTESIILRRLAEYHKDKPGAPDAWRYLLTWTWKMTSDICSYDRHHWAWTRMDFEQYEEMADLVDEIMTILQLNGDSAGLGVRRFEEDYIVAFLRKRERDTVAAQGEVSDGQSGPNTPYSQSAHELIPKPKHKISMFRKIGSRFHLLALMRAPEGDLEMERHDGQSAA